MPAPTERPNVMPDANRKNSFRPINANPMAKANPEKEPTAITLIGILSAIQPAKRAIVAAPPASPAKEKETIWGSKPFSIQ